MKTLAGKLTLMAAVTMVSLIARFEADAADTGTASQHGSLSAADYKFLADAANGSMMEVKLGEIAKQKATTTAVKNFAERMVTDHSKANEELKQIASQKRATMPQTISHDHQAHLDKLQQASGNDFDKKYADHMVRDHQKDVKEFQEAAKNLADPDLKAFAAKTLPTLQEHLRMAKEMDTLAKK